MKEKNIQGVFSLESLMKRQLAALVHCVRRTALMRVMFLIATFPTLLICWYKKGSLFGALAVGMGTVALIRYWMT